MLEPELLNKKQIENIKKFKQDYIEKAYRELDLNPVGWAAAYIFAMNYLHIEIMRDNIDKNAEFCDFKRMLYEYIYNENENLKKDIKEVVDKMLNKK